MNLNINKMSNTNIFVITHKDAYMPSSQIYKPLQAGKALTDLDLGILSDNTGDNISKKNPYFCELTGMYWIWKNIKGLDYVGINHYGRYFKFNAWFHHWYPPDFDKIFKNWEVIIFNPMKLMSNIEDEYNVCHNINDLHMCKNVLKDLYPEYYEDYIKYIKNGNTFIYGNCFIMRWKDYDDYCNFIFSILSEFENRSSLTTNEAYEKHVNDYCPNLSQNADKNTSYQKRIPGFLAERLTTLYIFRNFQKIYTTPCKKL